MNRKEFLQRFAAGLAGASFASYFSAEGGASGSAYAAGKGPNILFCIADDASYPHMSAYGCKWIQTPGFDRVAREGLLFNRAYTPNAKCAPSRSCVLTGRNSWQLEEAANHVPYFPDKFKTYPEALAKHGYFTGFTGKGWAPGAVGLIDGKPRQLAGPAYQKRTLKPPTGKISNKDYAANFQEFLDAKPDDKPFCFWFGAHEPHRAYEYGSGVAKGGKSIGQIDRVPAYWPDNDAVRNDMLDYAFEIEYQDAHLVRMLDLLEKRGELDNTLVVQTADNGMPFPRSKGQNYEVSNHMPLAVMWKRGVRNPGRAIEDLVSFIDLAPTFLEVAGVPEADSGMEKIQGRSLTDIFASEKAGRVNPERDRLLLGKERHDLGRPKDAGYPIRALLKGDYLYIRNYEIDRWPSGNPETGYMNCDGGATKTDIIKNRKVAEKKCYWQWAFGKREGVELFNIRKDPDCMNNLADDAKHRKRKVAFEEQLVRELKAQGDPRMFGQGHIFDEYPYSADQHRGYYERVMGGEKIPAGWINKTDVEPNFPD